MVKWSWVLVLLFAVPITVSADTTKEEIIKLAKAGISDEVITAFVKRNPLPYDLTSDDIIELKKAGVSDKVVNSLLAGPEKAPVEKSPAKVFPETTPRTRIVEKVYVPSPSTVYYTYPSTRSYYYTYPTSRYYYSRYPSYRYRSSSYGPAYYSPSYSSTVYRSRNWSFGVNWCW